MNKLSVKLKKFLSFYLKHGKYKDKLLLILLIIFDVTNLLISLLVECIK